MAKYRSGGALAFFILFGLGCLVLGYIIGRQELLHNVADLRSAPVDRSSNPKPLTVGQGRAEDDESVVADVRLKIEAHAEPLYRDWCLELVDGKPTSNVQAWQDWFAYHNYFRNIPYGAGFFLDLGANHGQIRSNTLFLEKCLGWRGLCVEPNVEYHPSYALRNCTLIKNCLFSEEKWVRFDGSGGEGGHISAEGQGSEVLCRPLEAILEEHGVKRVDFVNLDIEGGEVDTLRCFPFEKFDIRIWNVETARIDRDYFDYLMNRGGYYKVITLLSHYSPEWHPNVGDLLDTVYEKRDTPLKLAMPEKGLPRTSPCRMWPYAELWEPKSLPGRIRKECNPMQPFLWGKVEADYEGNMMHTCPGNAFFAKAKELVDAGVALPRVVG